MTFILFNYLYDIIHIYKPQLIQMVNYMYESKIIFVSVIITNLGKWRCYSFDQSVLSISTLISLEEPLLMILEYILEFKKDHAL